MTISLRTVLLAVALIHQSAPGFARPLNLEQAIAQAVAAAPSVKAEQAAIAAARAGRLQAGLRPNPSLTLEAENLVGSGPYNVLDQAEITASYNHTLERGGKRAARMALADSDIAVAEAASAVARLDLAAQVQRAFLDLLLADEAVKTAHDAVVIARGLQHEAERRVRSAKDPLFVGTNAAARLARAQIALDQAERRQAMARAYLASFWGSTGDDIEAVGDPVSLADAIGSTPMLAEADSKLAELTVTRASREITFEKSRAKQDYVLSGGTRFLRETNDVAVVAGITIPLGRFDRNQGNIARAEAEKQRLELKAEADRLERLRTLAALRREAAAAHVRADAIRRQIYPQVTKAMAQVEAGYARGGFTFRDMEAAADAIFNAQSDYLDALATLRAASARIDRLTGRFASSVSGENSQ